MGRYRQLAGQLHRPPAARRRRRLYLDRARSAQHARRIRTEPRLLDDALALRGWSAGYSLQFEIGPLSEASIGNVGRDPKTTGWVDYVVTPGGGLAILLAEDALDHFFIKWVEERSTNRVARASIRMLFNPARTFANLAMNRPPWSRDGRSLSW